MKKWLFSALALILIAVPFLSACSPPGPPRPPGAEAALMHRVSIRTPGAPRFPVLWRCVGSEGRVAGLFTGSAGPVAPSAGSGRKLGRGSVPPGRRPTGG